MPGRFGVVVVVAAALGCSDGPRYELSFVCSPMGSAECPAGQPCPTFPLGMSGCEGIPPVEGHPAIPLEVGYPEACVAFLPWSMDVIQMRCTCVGGGDGGVGTESWSCFKRGG
jgi:hypothetical protein